MFRNSQSLALWLSIAVSVVAIVLAFMGVNGLPLVLCGLPLVLFLPGYTLLRLLNTFSVPGRKSLTQAQIWLFSFGLSLLLTLVGGIVLNILPWGLQPGSWAIWLGGLTLLFVFLRLAQPGFSASSDESFNSKFASIKFKPLPAGLIGGAVALVLAAFLMARAGAAQPTGDFTQLWLLPAASTTANVATTATAGTSTGQSQPQRVNLGISNQENAPATYRLQLVSGSSVIQEWPSLELASGQTWKTTVTLPDSAAAAGVEARLYRLDQPDASSVYRQVFFAPSTQAAPAPTATARP